MPGDPTIVIRQLRCESRGGCAALKPKLFIVDAAAASAARDYQAGKFNGV
jgi:hypothetical protein